ncbi:DUF134 domain-containing protein [Clostridium sp. D2Q-11]|uniref:UPF0251 protein GOQ27_09955 n=1 Tax=Anaeromonas frigoriresistens TaxID=2683708 RepID=A0A942UXT9_9FIRM|nr:DUF134 domain-containing protein [Anaeromonas frigoriresistens]MBS4538789.1 DUF134 domain-containing protein [Anaeromonas frigoriresistens]
MPRPRKRRRVCCLPESKRFGPVRGQESLDDYITMTVDEYETIRLIDLNDFTQKECSEQMNVARTTVQSIYNDARKKLADSLINGRIIVIEGGDYKLCEGGKKQCGRGCRRRRLEEDLLIEE